MNPKHLPFCIAFVLLLSSFMTGSTQSPSNAPLATSYVDTPIHGYQSPCQPGVQANVSTFHGINKDGKPPVDRNRRAYDWRCHEAPPDGKGTQGTNAVYAPIGGKVVYSEDEGEAGGMMWIRDEVNDACVVLLHLDHAKNTVAVNQTVMQGQKVGEYPLAIFGHVHLAAVDGPCEFYTHAKERPIVFKEIGHQLAPAITLDGTASGSDGPKVWVTAGSCVNQTGTVCADSPDYPPAKWVPAHGSNFGSGRSGTAIDTIVIHTMQGLYGPTISYFTRPANQTSAHYFVRSQDGEVTQMVADRDEAWHAGHRSTNSRSVGIEHEGYVSDGAWYTEAMYQASAALVRHLVAEYNIPKDRDHIIGHHEVPGCPYSGGGADCHTDPGANWDWSYFMSLIEGDPHRDWDEEPPSPTGHFPDVEINHTFFGYIEALFAMGAIQGSGSGLYGSDDDVTRGQAAKMLTEALAEYRTYDDGECPFLDVCPGHTFYHHIRRLKELGITTGFDDSSYRPDAPLTRAETVTLIIRSRGESPDYADCVNPFSDVLCDNAHYHNVRRLKALFDEKGISLGHGDGTFRPDEAMSRGGIAKLIVVGLDLEGYIPRFFDVLSDNKFYLYIQGIAARGITDGCGSNPPLFCHDDLLTRGQASKFVARGLGEEPTYDDSVLPFPDVNPGDTFYIYIRRLKELDVISGFRDGSFRANQNITRGEMAKLIVGALASQGVVCRYEADPEFSDVAITDTFYREIQCLKELGITSGFSDSTFRADKTITRAAAAKFIYLAFVQRTPSLAQEESDVRNNSRATAPLYAELTHNDIGVHAHGGIPPLVLPANDEDWIQLPSAAQAASLARALTYEMTIESASINTDVCMQVFNEAGEILAAQGSVGAAGARLSQNANSRLVWSPSAGDGTRFYLRLTNMNPYAKEGAFVYLNVETSTGGTPTDPGTATPSPTTVPSTPTDGTPTTTPTRQPDSTIRSLYLPLMAQDNEQNRLVYAQHIDRTEACPGPNDSGIERTPTSAPTAETPMSTPVPPTYTSTPTPVQPTATPVPPTPTFTPTPTPFEFTDDFSNASSGWNTNTASDYRTYYGSNDFRIEINGGNREVWETNSNARVNGFDYVAMVDGELNAGGPIRYGLIFDILDGRNFYVFTVNPESQSWRLELVQNGSRSTLREGTSSSIKQGGRANLIEIHRTGNTIKAVVEFNTVTTISSRAFTGDLRVGLVAKAGNDSATAEFDDFELQEIVGR